MKNIIYLLLGLTLFMNSNMLVLAIDEENIDENEVIENENDDEFEEENEVDDDEATEEDDAELLNVESRNDFLEAVMVKKSELENLRTQINEARSSNNELMLQLKNKIKNQNQEQIKAKLAEIKALRKKIKDEVSTAKNLIKEKDEIESNETELDNVVSDNSRKNKINEELSSKKDLVSGYRSELEVLKQEIKQYKEEKQNQYKQIKQLNAQIKTHEKNLGEQEALQNQVWSDFKSSLENSDYKEAIDAFDNVIEVKTDMLAELEARGELLEEINELY